jgi:hypothetical protein
VAGVGEVRVRVRVREAEVGLIPAAEVRIGLIRSRWIAQEM